jgi:hypothetical protein
MRPTKRAWPSSELPPLSVDVPGRNPQRLLKLAKSAGASGRLQTLAQLADKYVRDLHTGEFVARSEMRWQSFDGVDSPNSARDRSICTVKQSAALVIQCAWRRHVAVKLRELLATRIWRRQLDIAARITQHSTSLTQTLQVVIGLERPRLRTLACVMPTCGFYFHAPAQLLSWWLGFTCAHLLARRVLRHPPASVRAVDLPVKLTCGKLAALWRCVVPLAALILQCRVRVSLARREVGKRRRQRLQLEAARRLQGFVRVHNARYIARKLRRWCAARRIQCQWRCHRARRCLQQRRMTWAATCVCTPLMLQAARQATTKLRLRSARVIQKHYRGCRARAQFRELLSCHEQQRWRQNPSKGFDFFELKRYDQAALYLENCFRQGIFTDEDLPVSQPAPTGHGSATNAPYRKLVSGSRMSFSFSTTPAQLGTDWILQRDNTRGLADSTSAAARLAGRLHFWQAYAISHFAVFEATGNAMNLKQARVGWESYLQVDTVAGTWPPFQAIAVVLKELRIRSQYALANCLFWGGKHSEKEKALGLSLSLLHDIPRSDDDATPSDAANLRARLLMLSSMLYFEQNVFAKSCAQLEKLLDTPSQNQFSDLEIRFTLALVLLKRYETSLASRSEAFTTDDPEADTLLRTAALLLKQCYQVMELWPSVGFYHGWLKKSDAKRLLATARVGSFLLHHSLDPAAADSKPPTYGKAKPADKLLLQVKLSERPPRIASMRIEFTDTGRYKTRRLPDHPGHFSLHELVRNLPPEAGVQIELGIRKSLYTAALRKKLEQTQPDVLQEKLSLRARLLHWGEWERKINETAATRFSETARRWKRRNETWSAACFEVAKALECSEAWTFAELAACEALAHSKDRSVRANVSFLAARVALNTQKRNESSLLMQQARLEMVRERRTSSTRFFIDNLAAVQRAVSLNVSLSRQEPFSSRLERIQKLERLCLKAWRYDSLAPRLRGNALHEALLLQRIADEMYADCGDTFFTRSLLKAHVRAYVMSASWQENLHLKCAYACVAQLFGRFHKHQDSWPAQLANMTSHVGGITQSKTTGSKSRAFNIKLLLLSWHHMPFLLCFEMAEVLYRYKSRSASTLIDVYESLQGRLRGSQPRTPTYAAYEELILLRLSFLHAAKVTPAEHSWRHLDAAVSALDELFEQRRERERLFTSEAVKKRARRIKWPCCIRLPFWFSDAEILFVRGGFTQLQEDLMRIPVERRSSWRDFHALHRELMELAMKFAVPGEVSGGGGRMLNSVRYRADNLRGLRVFVGATHDVALSNVLLSQPFVAIRHEGKTTPTRTPPTWTNLSPSWEEDVEVPVSSAHTNITVSVMNRTRRNSRWQDADTIGYVSLSMHELLAARDGITEGKYYELTLCKPASQRPCSGREERRSKVAHIFLNFQVIVKPQPMLPPSAKRTATWATRSGNWDVEDVRVHLHGDLRVFVSNRWIWSRFASIFNEENDLFIAKWFFLKSVRLTPELQRRASNVGSRLNTTDALAIVNDLVGLSRCYRANPSDARWGDQAAPLLGQAETLLTRRMSQQKREYCSLLERVSLDKQLADVRELLADARGTPRRLGPLEEALARKVPATSEWIKMTSRKPSGGILTRYLNQDTGEVFQSRWRLEPLEYEDKQVVMTGEQEHLPHRIVVMASEMKARVTSHRQELLQLHAEDPFQWVAVFNDRRKEIQFFSPHFPEAFSSRSDDKYPARPPSDVMLADEFLLYHVLLVQDAYRRYSCRRQRHHRLRGVFMSACWTLRELVAARRRVLLRSLNCIRVVVEKAKHLRAGDLLTSDPFVDLALTDPTGDVVATGETSVRYNSLNPKWNEEFHFRYSFAEHQEQQRAASTTKEGAGEAVLTLKVFDRDVVSKGGNSRKQGPADENSEQSHDSEDRPKDADDFLGMATIPIQSFTHGKRMTADLPLCSGVTARTKTRR